MFVIYLIIGISLISLILGSIFDLKSGEIPEVISRTFIFLIFLLAFIESIADSNPSILLESLGIGIIYFLFGYIMFYLGECGGGDVKLLSGIGLSLGLLGAEGYFDEMEVFPYFVSYFINMAIVSSPYVIIYSFILGLINTEVFEKFKNDLRNFLMLVAIMASFLPSIMANSLGLREIALLYLMIPFLLILSIYLRAVEKVALQKEINVNDLKEGDIVANDIIINNKKIALRRNIEGLTREQISEIQKLAKKGEISEVIRIRWGIKFAPILLFSYLLTVLVGDFLEIIVRIVVGS